MNASPRIGIIGAGAIGGFYGLMLARAGFDVHFLLRSEFAAVASQGLQVFADVNARIGSANSPILQTQATGLLVIRDGIAMRLTRGRRWHWSVRSGFAGLVVQAVVRADACQIQLFLR